MRSDANDAGAVMEASWEVMAAWWAHHSVSWEALLVEEVPR